MQLFVVTSLLLPGVPSKRQTPLNMLEFSSFPPGNPALVDFDPLKAP